MNACSCVNGETIKHRLIFGLLEVLAYLTPVTREKTNPQSREKQKNSGFSKFHRNSKNRICVWNIFFSNFVTVSAGKMKVNYFWVCSKKSVLLLLLTSSFKISERVKIIDLSWKVGSISRNCSPVSRLFHLFHQSSDVLYTNFPSPSRSHPWVPLRSSGVKDAK